MTRVGLVHGLAESGAVWRPLRRYLPARWRVRAPDLPWSHTGAPQWHRDADLTAHLDPIGSTVDVLVAHSFGANVALEYVQAQARPLAGLVLIAPFYRPAPDDFDWTVLSYYLNDFHRFLEYGIAVRAPGLPADFITAMAVRARDRIGPGGWLRFFETYLRTPWLDLTAIRVPCLVLAAEHDFAAPPADGRALADRLPDARLRVLAGCGHLPMIERPAQVGRLLAGFVSGTAGGRRASSAQRKG
jgi:pimeloyl-ACP methyl ester carboxylesterase